LEDSSIEGPVANLPVGFLDGGRFVIMRHHPSAKQRENPDELLAVTLLPENAT
jgi:hypothetical protein